MTKLVLLSCGLLSFQILWTPKEHSQVCRFRSLLFSLRTRAPHIVRIWKYAETDWQSFAFSFPLFFLHPKKCSSPFLHKTKQVVESFSKGQVYYFNTVSGVTSEKKIPPEIQGKEPLTMNYMEQNIRVPTPPTSYPKNMPRERNIITNAYPVRGGLLNKAIEVYNVTFDPPIPTSEVRKRSLAVFGKDRKKQHENRSLLMDRFGYFEFDNMRIYSLGKKVKKEAFKIEKLCKEYKIRFHWRDTVFLESPNLPIEQQESLFNIFNRKKLARAVRLSFSFFLFFFYLCLLDSGIVEGWSAKSDVVWASITRNLCGETYSLL